MDEISKLKTEIQNLREEIQMLKLNIEYFRYSHGEIEMSCGGETAMAVRSAVLLRRYNTIPIHCTQQIVDTEQKDFKP